MTEFSLLGFAETLHVLLSAGALMNIAYGNCITPLNCPTEKQNEAGKGGKGAKKWHSIAFQPLTAVLASLWLAFFGRAIDTLQGVTACDCEAVTESATLSLWSVAPDIPLLLNTALIIV
eukprot:scaffold313718_cov43-Prasinocladus_malaysianus.AAC.1